MNGQDGKTKLQGGVHKKAQRRSLELIRVRLRRRDYFALGFFVAAILSILLVSGTLGFVEAATSFVVYVCASLAYFIATSEVAERVEAIQDTPLATDAITPPPPDRSAENIRLLKTLLGKMPEPVCLVSEDRKIVGLNSVFAGVFNLPEELGPVGVSVLRRRDLLSSIEKVFKTGTDRVLEIRVSGEQDQVYVCRASRLFIEDNGFVLNTLEDLTAIKRAEQARADFLANASHELRTPLTSLSGFIETMRGPAKDDPESWDRFLEIMYAQTERMRRLIHDLLSLSRIELSEHTPPDTEVDLSSVIAEVTDALGPVAKNRTIQLKVNSEEDALTVLGFRAELSQVVQNLIDNAIKYSPAGSTVTVTAKADLTLDTARKWAGRQWDDAARMSIASAIEDTLGRFVIIRVCDEGEGISREHLPRLGERFYRIDKGRDRKIGGTGLGLAIVKHITTRHRGSFVVETRPGAGSAFGIVLPQPESAAPSRENTVEAAE